VSNLIPLPVVPSLTVCSYFVYALAYWWGAKQVRDGDYTTRDFFMVLPAILFSAQAAGQIFSLAPDIGRARNAASRVFALHDQRPTIDAISNAQISQSPMVEGKLHPPAGSITFQNVGLMYQSRPDAPLFKNLNLTIKPGETVALVGRSLSLSVSTIPPPVRSFWTVSTSGRSPSRITEQELVSSLRILIFFREVWRSM
jgi:ATP-binding cassette subfamily B (MDR/TAP) protein 1